MARQHGPIHWSIESLLYPVGFVGLDQSADFRISERWWVMPSRMDLTSAKLPKPLRSYRRQSDGL
jgi:hypothetical protein